jgi:hypothetical protein
MKRKGDRRNKPRETSQTPEILFLFPICGNLSVLSNHNPPINTVNGSYYGFTRSVAVPLVGLQCLVALYTVVLLGQEPTAVFPVLVWAGQRAAGFPGRSRVDGRSAEPHQRRQTQRRVLRQVGTRTVLAPPVPSISNALH